MYDNYISKTDPEIAALIRREVERQEYKLELIASENYTTPAVMEACGSVLTNKYAEGYPGRRFYGGCEFVDGVEAIAIGRAMDLFGAEYCNVQPHSGSNANIAVYYALLEPGDTVLGMDLASGGHLTHGSKGNLSGKYFNFIPYGVDPESGRIDFAALRKLAEEHRPKLIVAGVSAYPRILESDKFREIADDVGALLMVDMAHFAGLVAGGQHPNPVGDAHVVTSTTHKTLRGPRGGLIFAKEEFGAAIDKAIFPGIQGGPLEHVIAGKAICLKESGEPSFAEYQRRIVINAKALANELLKRGFDLISGGTDNHLILVDLRSKGVTGMDAEFWLDEANITTNKNNVFNDPQGPMVTSGLRLGTPALTTRGFGEAEMTEIADAIALVIDSRGDAAVAAKVRDTVARLVEAHPLYYPSGDANKGELKHEN